MKKLFLVLALAAPAAALTACGDRYTIPVAPAGDVMSYAEFHSKYQPHSTLPAPDSMAVQIVANMDGPTAASICAEYIKDPKKENRETWALVITSVPRPLAGSILDNLGEYTAPGLNMLNDDWARELLWFASEATYDRVAKDVVGMHTPF